MRKARMGRRNLNPPNRPFPSGPAAGSESLMARREALLGRRLKGGERELSFSFQVTTKDQGRRLDQFLSETNLNLSRSQAKNLIQKHHILLNQKLTKPSAHIKAGDTVSGALGTSGASDGGKGVFGFGFLWRERQ